MKKLAILLLFGNYLCFSQSNQVHFDLENPNADFYEIQRSAELFFTSEDPSRSLDTNETGDGDFEKYTRWESFWKSRVKNTETRLGDMTYLNDAMIKYIQNQGTICSGTSDLNDYWASLGPIKDPFLGSGSSTGQNLGMIISLWVHPQNSNVIYAGGRFGGLFRTANGNSGNPTWVSVTDNSRLPFQGIKSIIVIPGNGDPLDTSDDIILIASGTRAFDRAGYGMGVWKSNDDGQTWNPTNGLSYSLSNKIRTHKIVNATNEDVFFTLNDKTNH